jgi:hypothetical protein
MKKVLAVVALVAAFGSVHAQPAFKIGGSIAYDIKKLSNAPLTVAPVSTSNINLTATESFGGGVTLKAYTEIQPGGNGTIAEGNDLYLEFDAPTAGTVKVGQVEIKNGIYVRGLGGAPVIGLDGTVLAKKGNFQLLEYKTPSFNGFKLELANTRAFDNTGVSQTAIGATYTDSVVSAGIDRNQTTERVRASASVIVKGVKFGAGISRKELKVADSSVFGVSYAMGAVTVGAAYSKGNGTGTEYGIKYDLSKRTYVQLALAQVSDNKLVGNLDTYRFRVSHTF